MLGGGPRAGPRPAASRATRTAQGVNPWHADVDGAGAHCGARRCAGRRRRLPAPLLKRWQAHQVQVRVQVQVQDQAQDQDQDLSQGEIQARVWDRGRRQWRWKWRPSAGKGGALEGFPSPSPVITCNHWQAVEKATGPLSDRFVTRRSSAHPPRYASAPACNRPAKDLIGACCWLARIPAAHASMPAHARLVQSGWMPPARLDASSQR